MERLEAVQNASLGLAGGLARPGPHPVEPTAAGSRAWGLDFAAQPFCPISPIIDKLQRQPEILFPYERYDNLQVMLFVGRYAEFVALDLSADSLWALIPDKFGDLPRVVLRDPFFQADAQPELLARWPWLRGVDRLERHAAPDQLLLEHVEYRLRALFAVGADFYAVVAGPRAAGTHSPEVEPGSYLFGRLVQRVIDFLVIHPAHNVERRIRHTMLPSSEALGSRPIISGAAAIGGSLLSVPWLPGLRSHAP